jgi:hypothetical protein
MSISLERCFNHASREAVARCPECSRTFCRECISEHEGRVICASCLKRISTKAVKGRRFTLLVPFIQVFMGVLLLWSSFYLLGKALLTIPSSFHEITIGERRLEDK